MTPYSIISEFFNSYGYLSIFAVIFIAEIGVPLPIPFPSEMVFLFAGYTAYLNKFNFLDAVLIGAAADFLGSFAVYQVIYHLQDIPFLKNLLKKLESDKGFKNVEKFFRKRAGIAILVGRMIPYLRYYVSIVSGVSRVSIPKFIILSLFSSTIWAFLITYIGFSLGHTIIKTQDTLLQYHGLATFISILIPVLIFYYIIRILLKKNTI